MIKQKETTKTTFNEIKHLVGHKYGVQSLTFSPDSEYLISLGDPNDKGIMVWDWKNEKRLSTNKLARPALEVAFSQDQSFFVTAGYNHLKFWYFDE